MNSHTNRSFTRTTFYISAGLLIWVATFLATYVLAAVACARGILLSTVFGMGLVPLMILAATVIAMGLTARVLYIAIARYRRSALPVDAGRTSAIERSQQMDRFIHFLAAAVAGLSLAAIVLNGTAAIAYDSCRATGAPDQHRPQ